MHKPTYTYSQLSASSAGELVADHYALAGPLEARFYVLGLHDNYLIESLGGRYMLRIYRNAWRSHEEIQFELELLAYLREGSAPVASPVRTVGGDLGFRIESPEGERMAALFHYAEGRAPAGGLSADDCVVLGRAVWAVHRRADGFVTDRARRALDLDYLVDESIEAIRPFLGPEARSYLDGLHERLHAGWPHIPADAGVFGACIGDVNATNFHVAGDGEITLFDFDQCGLGFRAFEIGKFASSLQDGSAKRALVGAFLDGYQEGRALSRAEYEAIPYFELVAHVWVLAIHANNVDRIGYKRLEHPFWDRNLAILRQREARQGARAQAGVDAPCG